MKRSIQYLIVALTLLFSANLKAQSQTVGLTMEEAIESTLISNAAIQSAEIKKNIASENYKQSKAVFLPQADVKYTAMATNNPLNAFGFKLQQQEISATDFNPALLNNPGNTSNFSTSLNVQQPLINIDKLMQRKGASMYVSSNEYVLQRTKEQMVFETKKAYIQLGLAYRLLATLEESLLASKAQEIFVKNRFGQGLVQKSDVLNVEIQVRYIESQLKEAHSNIKNASDQLSLLMGRTLGTVYTVNETVLTEPNPVSTEIPSDRADLKALSKAIESSEWMKKGLKSTLFPTVNAFGSYYLNDKNMLGFGSSSYLVGLQIEWKIFRGTRNMHAIKSENLNAKEMSIQLDEQKKQSQLILNKTIRETEDLESQLIKQEKAVEQSNEVLNQTSNRYREGLALTNDLLFANTQLLQQKLLLQQLIASRYILKAFLEFQTTTSN